MNQALEQRIEAYLDGHLGIDEADALERSLSDPETARAFGQALMLRELLRDLPPESPPHGLVDKIQRAMALRQVDEQSASGFNNDISSMLQALGWMFWGPAQSLTGLGTLSHSARASLSGVSSIGRTVGQTSLPSLSPPSSSNAAGLLKQAWRLGRRLL